VQCPAPDSDPGAPRNVALWFNIDEKKVIMLTPQQSKRYRYKRPKKEEKRINNSAFDHLDCFFMIRPHDHDAFKLTTRILQHRLGVLQSEHTSASMRDQSELFKALYQEKQELKKLIENHINHWKRWAWPINQDRDHINEDTRVPTVDGPYYKDSSKMALVSRSDAKCTAKIWESFVSNKFMEGFDQTPVSVSFI